MTPHLFVIIPAYNEEKTVGEVIRKIFALHVTGYMLQVLVVDDGSNDNTAEVAHKAGAIVLRHPINRGVGAALSTGIAGALRLIHNAPQPPLNLRGGVIVTLDGDGKHDRGEIPRLIEPIAQWKAEVVIGSRFMGSRQARTIYSSSEAKRSREVPLSRRIANLFGNFFTWLLFGIWVSDSQSGFRAFSKDAAERLRLRTSTMEVSSEIIREIARLKLKLTEVPITVRYTAYSLSKGQGFMRGLETLWKLIVLRFFR